MGSRSVIPATCFIESVFSKVLNQLALFKYKAISLISSKMVFAVAFSRIYLNRSACFKRDRFCLLLYFSLNVLGV